MFHHLFKGCGMCGDKKEGREREKSEGGMCGYGHGCWHGRRWIFRAFLIAFVLVIGLKLTGGWGTDGEFPNVPTITVSGEGKVLAKPDIGIVTFSVWRESKDVGTAQTEATKATNAIVDYLKGAGVEEKDLKTTSYNITPMYDYTRGGSIFRGYQIRQSFELKIRDLAKVGAHLTKIAQLGANDVGSLRFDIDDADGLRAEARAKAIADAKAKAKILARSLGVRLDDIVSFSEGGGGGPVPIFFRTDMGIGGAEKSIPPATPTGENEIIVNVSIGFQVRD